MVYVYGPKRSADALKLVRALEGHRLRRFDGLDFWSKHSKRFVLNQGDSIVCWGGTIPELEGVRVLNGLKAPTSLYDLFKEISEVGIPIIRFYQPASVRPTALLMPTRYYNPKRLDTLLILPDFPEWTVFKEEYSREFRVHSFEGRAIKTGLKVPKPGFEVSKTGDNWLEGTAHPWIRSSDCGWTVDYTPGIIDASLNTKIKKYAHAAVKATGLTFAAVDLAELANGSGLKCIGLDPSPSLEGGLEEVYLRAINRWLNKEVEVPSEEE